MRTLTAILIICLLSITNKIYSQDCPVGDVVIMSQEDLDQFVTNFPTCTAIEGNFSIVNSDIVNLDQLELISEIDGKLSIIDNADLSDIQAITQITRVGSIFIRNNNKISFINGFNKLDSLSSLSIFSNDSLATIQGFTNMVYSDALQIGTNINLLSLPAFDSLIECNRIEIGGNLKLEEIVGFDNLLYSLQFIRIGEANLLKLVGFNQLKKSAGIVIGSDIGFSEINAFNSVDSILGQLNISRITQSSPVGIFNNVKFIGRLGLFISRYQGGQLNGFQKLSSINGATQFVLIRVSNFENLNFLSNLQNASGFKPRILLNGNANLIDISGLDGLNPDSIQRLEISNNPMLSVCHSDLICGILEREDSDELDIIIEDNAEGCNSEAEIKVLCDLREDPNDGQSSCPSIILPGMQVNRKSATHYEIIYTYGDKRMAIDSVTLSQTSEMIDHFFLEKYWLFDRDSFSLENFCVVANKLAQGETFSRPTSTSVDSKYEQLEAEIKDCQAFIEVIDIADCIKW